MSTVLLTFDSPPAYSSPLRRTWESSPADLAFFTPPSSPTTPTGDRAVPLPLLLPSSLPSGSESVTTVTSPSDSASVQSAGDRSQQTLSEPSLATPASRASARSAQRLEGSPESVRSIVALSPTNLPCGPYCVRRRTKKRRVIKVESDTDEDTPQFISAKIRLPSTPYRSEVWKRDPEAAAQEQQRLFLLSQRTTGVQPPIASPLVDLTSPSSGEVGVEAEQDIELDELDESECEFQIKRSAVSDRTSSTSLGKRQRHARGWTASEPSIPKIAVNSDDSDDDSDVDGDPTSPLVLKLPSDSITTRGRCNSVSTSSPSSSPARGGIPPTFDEAHEFFMSGPVNRYRFGTASTKLVSRLIASSIAYPPGSFDGCERRAPRRLVSTVVPHTTRTQSRPVPRSQGQANPQGGSNALQVTVDPETEDGQTPHALAKVVRPHRPNSPRDSDTVSDGEAELTLDMEPETLDEINVRSDPDAASVAPHPPTDSLSATVGLKTWCAHHTLSHGRKIGPKLGLPISKDGGFLRCAERYSEVEDISAIGTVSIMLNSPKRVPRYSGINPGVVGVDGPMGVLKGRMGLRGASFSYTTRGRL